MAIYYRAIGRNFDKCNKLSGLHSVTRKLDFGLRYFTMALKSGKDSVDLTDFRVPYNSDDVDNDFALKDPVKLFDVWFAKASETPTIKEANAMALATADKSGSPSVRYVLLKGYGKDGFVFFTNHNSRKGRELAENPNAALLFYWDDLCRQVRIEGSVVKASEKESEEYFNSRPRSSRISAVVSPQSTVIENKNVLLRKHKELEQKYADESVPIPKPEYWGGYKVIPKVFEFWCGRTSRLHDRIRFRLPSLGETPDEKISFHGENGWIYEFLAP